MALRKTALIISLALLLGGYAAILLWFRIHEDAYVFNPERGTLAPPADSFALEARRVGLRAADSTPLIALVIPPPAGAVPGEEAWLLYLHGTGGNLGNAGYLLAWSKFRALGMGVFAVDYRGYGESGGKPSETGLYMDADAAYSYLRDSLGVPPARIVIYGFSLGSAVAIDLATRKPAGALIVEGALLSVQERGQEIYPFLPVKWLARNRFASVEKIARVAMPKLFIHARADAEVPFDHGRRLYALAAPPKEFLEVSGGHTTAYKVDPLFYPGVARFLSELGFPVASSPVPAHPAGD